VNKILLTGGSGFVGQAILRDPTFFDSINLGRNRPDNCKNFVHTCFAEDEDYSKILEDIDVIVHSAARAHIMSDSAADPLEEYRRFNTDVTLNLAKQAARKGVRRFIFISSVKVLGERTVPGNAFSHCDIPDPKDPYSLSKLEAEEGLRKLALETSLEFVIIRPPLVYGRGVKGNVARLQELISKEIPMPLKSIQNVRSLLSVENLVDVIRICLTNDKAKNETFLVSDDCDLTTSEIISLLAKSGGYKDKTFYFPKKLIKLSLSILGKRALYDRLFGSMQVDITHTKNALNWSPFLSPEACIKNCWLKDI